MTFASIGRTTLLMATTLFGSFFASVPANAASLHHIDELAVRLQEQSRQLAREFRFHNYYTFDYNHEMADANKLFREAAHIHAVIHNHGGLLHVRDDLRKLDGLYHHLEGLIAHRNTHAHGHGHGHGHGHIHGHSCRIPALMAAIGNTLHHLKSDVEAMTAPPIPAPLPIIPGHGGHGHGGHGKVGHGHGHGHGHGRGGITFGKGGFSIRFGF